MTVRSRGPDGRPTAERPAVDSWLPPGVNARVGHDTDNTTAPARRVAHAMTWIHQPDRDRGLPRRAPWMDDLLGADADDHLPLRWTGNRTANVPADLAEAMVERYDGIQHYENDDD